MRSTVVRGAGFVLSVAGAIFAQKPAAPASTRIPTTASSEMKGDQRVLHALNRLTFGPHPGDLGTVEKIGFDAWLEQQLHPETLAEDPALEARLAPLDTLRMKPAEMLVRYPSPQMIRAMSEGKADLPFDPQTRAIVQMEIARYEMRRRAQSQGGTAAGAAPDSDGGDARSSMRTLMAGAGIGDEQLRALRRGNPQQRAEALARLSPQARRTFDVLSAPTRIVARDLDEARLLRAIYSSRQLAEVLTDFWYNHFNVDRNKGADRWLVTSYERDAIRPNVLGKFEDLLVATAQSPAMLFYLDNWQSVTSDAAGGAKGKRLGLNENYARELLELHTLGVDGGYTQQDVIEVARCFTGWSIREPEREGTFQFNWRQHDNGEKHVLGVKIPAGGGMEDGYKVLHILAHHPSTARFISRSLAIRFVSDDPPAPLVERMARTFLASDGDLRDVMKAMIDSPEFWDASNFRSKVKSPLELVASAIRSTGADVITAGPMADLMRQLGEPLYEKQEPPGYSNRGMEWMNSAMLLARMNFGMALVEGRIAGVRFDSERFHSDPESVERGILFTEPSDAAQSAIRAGLDGLPPSTEAGVLAAGLTLGSPDFQRR